MLMHTMLCVHFFVLYMEIETIRNRYEDKQNELVDRYEQQIRNLTENKKKEGK